MGTKRNYTRVVVVSDLHCGALDGLTPDGWQNPNSPFYEYHQQSYNFYQSVIRSLKPIDICIVGGDCIDGRQEKQGSTGLITVDRDEQCDMAIKALKVINAKKYYICAGTSYHVGREEDFEKTIARALNADFRSHLFLDVNGVVFDVKHKVASSSVPYARGTAIAKVKLWNTLAALREEQPHSDIILRGHVHYHIAVTDSRFLTMTLPALKGMGGRYGERECDGTVDFGITYFDVLKNPKGKEKKYTWQTILAEVGAQKVQVLKA